MTEAAPESQTKADARSIEGRLKRRIVHAPGSPMEALIQSLERVAQSRANVLVSGESGAGKEGVVRALHDLSPWARGPFVPINCGAIPENLLESELFGHVKGAFTGADRSRIGRLETASNGTCFMDEIGEMPLSLQVKMLRVLQEMEFTPVGATTTRPATFRLVAATNRDLQEAIGEGSFREDLYFRLDVVHLQVPPLRERPMDIPMLAQHFLRMYADMHMSQCDGFTGEATELLQALEWSGNVRELENLVQGILVLKVDGKIDVADIEGRVRGRPVTDTSTDAPAGVELPEDGLDLRETVASLERDLIRQALRRSDGNKAQAASLLRMNRTTLVEKLKRQPLPPDG